MKKFLFSLVSILFVFSLAACNQKADPVDSKTKDKKGLTLQEVFEKTTDASKDIKSLHADMELNQKINIPGQSEPMDTKSNINVDMVLDPMTMHQKMKMEVQGGGQNQAIDMEAYLAKEGFFLFESTSKQWMKMPEELSKQVIQMPEQQANPAEQLKQLKQFSDDFSFKQNDTQYILNLKASGEKYDQFLKDSAKQLLPDQFKQSEELFKNISFKNVKYEIFIDKKTFNIQELNLTQEMDMKIENNDMSIKQVMNSKYSDYNKLTKITVPKDVLDNAQEMK